MEDREPRLRTRDDNLNLVPRGLLARLVEREFRRLRLTIYLKVTLSDSHGRTHCHAIYVASCNLTFTKHHPFV